MAKDDRLRIPVDGSYLHVIGLATYAFAGLEWNAVYVCESLQPGYIAKVGKKTAGVIAADLVRLVSRIGDSSIKAAATGYAEKFRRLAGRRNDLLHATPATAPGGDQRLNRRGAFWTISMVEELADEFAACSIELNDLYHGALKSKR